jgi:hypothetical protein
MASERMKECTCLGTCRGAEGLGAGWYCTMSKPPAVPQPTDPTRERHPVGGKGEWREQTFAALVDALRYGALEVPLLAEMLSYPGATKPDVGDQILWCANTLLTTPPVASREVTEQMVEAGVRASLEYEFGGDLERFYDPKPKLHHASLRRHARETVRRVLRAALGAAGEPETCEWRDEGEYFRSACGSDFTFIDGGPAQNGMKFCHNCGKTTRATPTPERAP